jgi:FkbM family methyltransferase
MHTPKLSIGSIIESLPDLAAHHARDSLMYQRLDENVSSMVASSGFIQESGESVAFGSFGPIVFPFVKMGAITTLDLFGLDELIIFAFYWANRKRYRKAADIGANLGLHSILMAKCGWKVSAYEPDPDHAKKLLRNLDLNDVKTVVLIEAAVSNEPGVLEFVRVLGNTTSSHLSGAKNNAYGVLERFPVNVESIAAIMGVVDFVKMDAEGQEKIIILGTTAEHWLNTDMILEVGTKENSLAIYHHLKQIGVRAFAQKLGWAEVIDLDDMPTHYKEGSLFITKKSKMPWG